VPNWRASWTRPLTTSSRRKSFLAGCSTGDGIDGRNGVCVGAGVFVSVGIGVGVAIGVGVGVDVGVAVGVDVGVGDRVCVGEGNGVGNSDSVGDGEGRATIGSSVGSVSAALLDCPLAAGFGVRLALIPGSDQSPTFSPFTNVVCNLVWPCSLITGPSNCPWTILPL
jgi:hypothetical protein